MTEQEKTEQAIKASKNKEQDTNIKKLNPDQLQLGPDRIVTLSPWNGKTKKKFKKLFEFVEDPSDIDLKRVMEVLIYDHVKEDFLLSDAEQQYILTILKEISISNNIEFTSICPGCEQENKLTCTTKETIYTDNMLPQVYKEISFINPGLEETKQVIKEFMDDDDYDGLTNETDIETASRIKIKDLKTKQVIEYLDNLAIKDVQDIMNKLDSYLPTIEQKFTTECKKCQTEQTFEIDMITGLFEDLLK